MVRTAQQALKRAHQMSLTGRKSWYVTEGREHTGHPANLPGRGVEQLANRLLARRFPAAGHHPRPLVDFIRRPPYCATLRFENLERRAGARAGRPCAGVTRGSRCSQRKLFRPSNQARRNKTIVLFLTKRYECDNIVCHVGALSPVREPTLAIRSADPHNPLGNAHSLVLKAIPACAWWVYPRGGSFLFIPLPRFQGSLERLTRLPRAHHAGGCKKPPKTATLTTFRNSPTCKSVSKQRTLNPFRIQHLWKKGGGGYH